jgi:hypothetical protein
MSRPDQYGTEQRAQKTLEELRRSTESLADVLAWIEYRAADQRRRVTKGDMRGVRRRLVEMGLLDASDVGE